MKIDKLIIYWQIFKNRKTVCMFIKDLSSNAKDKKLIVVIILGKLIYFNSLQLSEAIGL